LCYRSATGRRRRLWASVSAKPSRIFPVTAEAKELHITCSFGVAFTDTPGKSDVMALVRAADEALYRAKQNGRNCVQLAPVSTIAALCTA
jgi:diguanylate cyclase (GGDEF)-like protein